MDQWLTWSHIERGGGGSGEESYELGMYFLAEHTDMDCWVKRKRRGYMFMTGDERPYPAVSKIQVEAIIGDRLDEDIPLADVVAALSETFHPFFLIPDLQRRKNCEAVWRQVLGDHVICMESPHDTSFVAAAIVALTEGVIRDVNDIPQIVAHAGAAADRVPAIVRAVTPYAALLGKDGAPPPHATNRLASAWKRLTRR